MLQSSASSLETCIERNLHTPLTNWQDLNYLTHRLLMEIRSLQPCLQHEDVWGPLLNGKCTCQHQANLLGWKETMFIHTWVFVLLSQVVQQLDSLFQFLPVILLIFSDSLLHSKQHTSFTVAVILADAINRILLVSTFPYLV